MRFIKVILGVGCFPVALVPLALAWTAVSSGRFHLAVVTVMAIALALVLTAFCTVAAGFLLISRDRVLPRRTAMLLVTVPLIAVSLSAASLSYLRTHSMTASEQIAEDIRRIEAAAEQPINPVTNLSKTK